MFEADPNLLLQSFSAAWVLWCMTLVSELGTAAFYMAAFLVLAFGVRLKPMLVVLLALVVAGTAIGAIKLGFELPRPSEVDARVMDKGAFGHHVVDDGAAGSFWGLPSDDAIAAVRATGEMNYGFASGHASAATAFALGIALFFGFRQRWVWTVAIGWALLMGVSRMYLGRHFLGDVLGGWIIGVSAVWVAWLFVRAIGADAGDIRKRAWIVASAIVAALAVLSLNVSFLDPGAVGEIAGTLACLFVVERMGAFDEGGTVRRLSRIVLAFALAYGIDALLSTAWDAGGWPDLHPMGFLFSAIGYPLSILGIVFASRWLGLYRPGRADALSPAPGVRR